MPLNENVHVTSEEIYELAGPSSDSPTRKEHVKVLASNHSEKDDLRDFSKKETPTNTKRTGFVKKTGRYLLKKDKNR